MEARLRDEQIETTTIDVKVGALRGGEGIAIRSFESSVRPVLSTVLLVKQFPRSLLRLATQLTGADTDSAGVTLGKILETPADLDDTASANDAARDEQVLEGVETTPNWLAQGPPAPPLFTPSASLRASHKAVLINALSTALLDAAVPARGTLVAAHAILRPTYEGTKLSTSPSAAEEERALASFVFAFVFSGHQPDREESSNLDDLNDVLVFTDTYGSFDDAQLSEAIAACREVAKDTYTIIRQNLNA